MEWTNQPLTTSDHKPRRKVNLQPNIPPQLRSKSNLAYRTNDNSSILSKTLYSKDNSDSQS